MEKKISIVIPNYNKAETIGKCLEAAFSSDYNNYEVIVVDDYSDDNSVEIIKKFPCKLICLESRSGTSIARNTGALNSSGDVIFFIDADCLVLKDTLSIINETLVKRGSEFVIGGTYTRIPYDKRFCSIFQSIFVNYFETKELEAVDYIAAHALIIDARIFRSSGGFPDFFLPIIEDVAFGHKLRKLGYKLIMNPEIQVQHIFDFTLWKSLRNAFKKSVNWCLYSLKNKDLLVDSGCASIELKANVALNSFSLLSLILWVFVQKPLFLFLLPMSFLLNAFINRGLLKAFYDAKGALFAGLAFSYYTIVYPFPIGLATITATARHLLSKNKDKNKYAGRTCQYGTAKPALDCTDGRSK
ncbi:MAG: glycosyltransferase family 2 protein [Nitrospirae bacterium]|nr:glycosyltransferase family 2 protein [Nitrospirota bacterium]